MLKLVSQSSFLLIVLCSILFTSCRKEINHEEGTTISTQETGWKRISISPIYDVQSIESLGTFLYIGGSYGGNGLPGIAAYKPSTDTYYQITTGNILSGSVYDMEVHNGYLYVAGNFQISSSPFDLLTIFKVNSFSGIFNVDFSDYTSQTIYGLKSYGDTLITTGIFSYNSTTAPNIISTNVEFLQNDLPVGAANISIPMHSSCVANNEVYIAGENGYFGYFTGSNWGEIDYPNKSSDDIVYDLTTIGNKIYLLGKFQNKVLMRTFDWTTGQWGTVSSLGESSNLLFGAGFKWIDGELYVFGNDLYSLDGDYTNIFKSSNGVSWSPVGEITEYVRDVAKHDGNMYAASTKGLYRLNE